MGVTHDIVTAGNHIAHAVDRLEKASARLAHIADRLNVNSAAWVAVIRLQVRVDNDLGSLLDTLDHYQAAAEAIETSGYGGY